MKKIVWMLVSCLMVLSLVIASCAPEEEAEEKVVGEATVVTTEEVEKEVVAEKPGILPPEVPKYGGILTTSFLPIFGFDPFVRMFVFVGHVYYTGETLISGDWAKGPAGTGENDALASFGGQMKFMTGRLAESWELPDSQTIIFHIRKGVRYDNKPPANGREVTADDVVWNIDKAFSSPMAWQYMFTMAGNNPTSVKALDKYTVEIKVKPEVRAMMLLEIGNQLRLVPPDGWQAGLDMDGDWRNVCGAGPWRLADFVPDVSLTYERNPAFWQTDPLHPENRLPYMDGLRIVWFPDLSTLQAAIRTGRFDVNYNVSWEDWEMFMGQCPELMYKQTLPDFTGLIAMRTDKPELPYGKLEVRRALNMAINKQEMIDELYGGHGDMLAYPVKNMKSFESYYIPLEQLPESCQELFTYNPEKAKKLLEEAGYPSFKAIIQTDAGGADLYSLIREYWARIDVELELEIMEGGALASIGTARTYKELIGCIGKCSLPFFFWTERKEDMHNRSLWESPQVRAAYNEMNQVLGVDDAAVTRIMREMVPHILENAPYIILPLNHCYTIWWPWLQNFHAEQDIGYCAQGQQWMYTWIDTDLKRSMGY